MAKIGKRINKGLKKSLPQTTAGLVMYYEEDPSYIQIDPKVLIIFLYGLITLIILYKIMAGL